MPTIYLPESIRAKLGQEGRRVLESEYSNLYVTWSKADLLKVLVSYTSHYPSDTYCKDIESLSDMIRSKPMDEWKLEFIPSILVAYHESQENMMHAREAAKNAEAAKLSAEESANSLQVERKLIAELAVGPQAAAKALFYAAEHDCSELVALLVKQRPGAVDIRGEAQKTPLMVAVQKGHLKTINALLEHGAKVGLKDAADRMPLHMTTNPTIMKPLLEAHKKHALRIEEKADGMTPLMLAINGGHEESFDLIYEYLKTLDPNGPNGNTILHMAARSGKVAILRTLLINDWLKKDYLEKENSNEETALIVAVKANNVPMINALVDAGSEIDKFSPSLVTPVHIAVERGHLNALKALVDKGASLKIKNGEQNTVFHIAAKGGNMAIIKFLLEKYKIDDIDISGKEGRTPLMYAVNAEVAMCFVKAGASIIRLTQLGESALHIASTLGHKGVLEYLLSIGAKAIDINKKRVDGKTALDLASNAEIKDLLLAKGAVVGAPFCSASSSPVSKSTTEMSPTKLMSKKLGMVLNDLEDLPDTEGLGITMISLTEASAAIRKNDFQAATGHLNIAVEKMQSLGLADSILEVQTVLQQCNHAVTTASTISPQMGVPFESSASSLSSSSSSSSSSSPSSSPPDAGLQGKGEGSMTDGVNPGAMITQLEAKGLQCQIGFSRYETLPETVLSASSKALIELIGDGPAHWVLKFTLEEKILLIWPGEVPHDSLVSAAQVGIVVVSIHQNSEECAVAALNYLAMLEETTSSSSVSGQLLIESNEKAQSKVTAAADDSVETCIEVSDSFFNAIINAVMNFDPRSFAQQQLNELQELLQNGLNNVWLNAAQQFQLQFLLADVRGSLFMPASPFGGHGDDDDQHGWNPGGRMPNAPQADDTMAVPVNATEKDINITVAGAME